MEAKKSLEPDYFKGVYNASDDPWDFETSEYESSKYKATLAAIPKDKYENALEIGCSIGVLTEILAKKCHNLLSIDVSEKALKIAKERCKNLDHVSFKNMNFKDELPDDQFNLILISEVAYYLSPEDWNQTMARLLKIMKPDAIVILVHWLPEVYDYPQTGDEVHESFKKTMNAKMTNILSQREENYRMDVWERSLKP